MAVNCFNVESDERRKIMVEQTEKENSNAMLNYKNNDWEVYHLVYKKELEDDLVLESFVQENNKYLI